MIARLRRWFNVYGAFAAMVPKEYLAYTIWVWTEMVAQVITMGILVAFWRAVYAASSTVGGLDLAQTLNYILLAQILAPVVQNRAVFRFGFLIRQGLIAIELLRPVDFQVREYVSQLTWLLIALVIKIPILLIAIFVFGLQLPTSPAIYAAFFVALLLGQAVLFCLDWIFACIAFYSTETWGLSVVREGVGLFFSGALIPIAMMPDWLRAIADALPFAQALYVPVSLLSGITPIADAARAYGIQVIWLVVLALASRWIFGVAVRQVTVQGG